MVMVGGQMQALSPLHRAPTVDLSAVLIAMPLVEIAAAGVPLMLERAADGRSQQERGRMVIVRVRHGTRQGQAQRQRAKYE